MANLHGALDTLPWIQFVILRRNPTTHSYHFAIGVDGVEELNVISPIQQLY